MNQKAVTEAISQLQTKGDVFTRQVIIEQRRVDDISAVSMFFVVLATGTYISRIRTVYEKSNDHMILRT